MPNQYENPTASPCTGSYADWVPPTPPNIGGSNAIIGFDSMVINRGKFRNYYVPLFGVPAVIITTNGDSQGDPYSPIMNATRPLDLYTTSIKFANNDNFVGFSRNKDVSSNLITFSFPASDVSKPVSCVEITYDLSFWDKDLPDNFGGIGTCKALDLIGVYSSGITTTIASINPTRLRSQEKEDNLQYSNGDGESFQTIKIKTGTDQTNRSSYPQLKQIYFKSNYNPSSLVFALKKIMVFSADRVNLRFEKNEKQLPCAALGYSMLINGTVFPTSSYVSTISVGSGQLGFSGSTDSSGVFTWPSNDRLIGCNCHIKVFSPDYLTGSPGFAHSLNLHLMVLSFPTFGPLADAFGFPQPYYGVIVGPTPFVQQFAFKGTSSIISTSNTLTALSLISNLKPTSGTYNILQNDVDTGVKFEIQSLKDILNSKKSPSFEYISNSSSSTFKNYFTDQYGIETPSATYSGFPSRLTTVFNATDNFSGQNPTKKTFTYQSQIFYSGYTLSDVFSNTNVSPCLIYKLNRTFGDNSAITLQPGFVSASVNCFKTDTVGIFNSKLIYRVYALPKNTTSYDPNNSKYTMKIINDGSKDAPHLEFSQYNKSWDFNNVLISGNLESDLQTIFAEVLINSTKQSFKVTPDNSFDLYVAVYSICELNSNFANINFDKKSSFDLPLVNFTISDDFNISLPLYYLKSFSGGGNIQAIKDFGYTGSYTKDTSIYTLTNKLYNGSKFDNTKAYGTVLTSGGFSDLLTFSTDLPNGDTSFFIDIGTGTVSNPFSTEVDFFIITQELANGMVGTGDWQFTFSISTTIKKAFVKIELDLINTQDSTLVLKILTTPYQQITGDISFVYTITVPFSLSPLNTGLVMKIFIQNLSAAGKIKFSSAKISKTTIQFFNYSGNRPVLSAPLGFYEDMPLTPGLYVGDCTDFLLYLDLPSDGYVIFNAPDGIFINGSLKSPTWVVSCPEDMEVTYKTDLNSSGTQTYISGVTPYQLFFRTGRANSVTVLDTKKGGSSKMITTLVNKKIASSDFGVGQFTSESYLRFSSFSQNVISPLSNLNLSNLTLQYPIMAKSSELFLIGQNNQYSKTSSLIYNMNSPYSFAAQPSPDGTLRPADDSKYSVIRMQGCVYVATDYNSNMAYNLGITPQGNLLYSFGSLSAPDSPFQMQLVEGDPASVEIISLNAFTNNPASYNGKVSVSFPGLINLNGVSLIFYILQSGGTKIYAKDLTIGPNQSSSLKTGNTVEIFDINNYCPGADSIDNITVCKEELYPNYKLFHIAFGCGGKIFVIKVSYDPPHFFVYMPCLVYGDLSLKQKPFDQSLVAAIESSSIRKLNILSNTGQTTFYNKNLENAQKVGFVDYDGTYIGVQFLVGSTVTEIVFDKSYSQTAELRVIGTI